MTAEWIEVLVGVLAFAAVALVQFLRGGMPKRSRLPPAARGAGVPAEDPGPLRIDYRRTDGRLIRRTIHVRTVELRPGTRVAVAVDAYCDLKRAVRTFQVDRVVSATLVSSNQDIAPADAFRPRLDGMGPVAPAAAPAATQAATRPGARLAPALPRKPDGGGDAAMSARLRTAAG